MEGKKLTNKFNEGKHKGQEVAHVIETDVKYIQDQMENYGLVLENCAYAFYTFHLERVEDSISDIMY